MKDPHFDLEEIDELEHELDAVRVWAVVWLMMICGGLGWAMGNDTVAVIMLSGAIGFLHWMKEMIR